MATTTVVIGDESPPAYVGTELDGLVIGATSVVVPALGGHLVWTHLAMAFILTAKTGTPTGSLTFKVGTNAAHDNLCASGTTASAANFDAATVGYRGTLAPVVLSTSFNGAPALSGPLTIEILAAFAGATVLKIKPIFFGMAVPNP